MHHKFLLLMLILINPALSPGQTTKWNVDTLHTSVRFEARHLGIAVVAGQFMKFSGSMVSDKVDFTDAKIEFIVQTNSINTNVEMRDNDLRSERFFDVKKFPEMSFRSTKFQKQRDGTSILSGDLTIKDVTKPVNFIVTVHPGIIDPWGNTRAGFRAEVTINRFDYHIRYDETFGDNILHVAPDVKIIIDTEVTKTK